MKSGPNSYVVTPPSRVRQDDGSLWEYRWIQGYEWKEPLPFPEDLFPDTRTEVQRTLTRGQVANIDGYLAKIESVSGREGSRGLVRAAAVCRDAGMTEADTTAKLLSYWNTLPVVSPRWSPQEIARAVHRVFQKGGAA